MEVVTNNGMCRCCASEGTFKDVSSKYLWMGEEEVYADMLRDCFDISLCPPDDGYEGGICEVCITQLRNAANFKKQVLHTEEQFKQQLHNRMFKDNIVKVEAGPTEDEDHLTDNDNHLSDDYSGPEYEVPIKTETSEEPKAKKRSKTTSGRAKKPKLEDGETSTKRHISRKTIIKLTSGGKTLRREIIDIIPKPPITIKLKKRSEVHKHLENITSILLSSNATPIRCKGSTGYACSFCSKEYPEPIDLKTHTLNNHDDVTKSNFMKGRSLNTYLVKLDITDLKCNMCNVTIDSLDFLTDHIRVNHNRTFHNDIKSHIVPFSFDTENLRCVVCRNEFNNFKVLLQHMKKHYRNYICEVCGEGFVNERILQTHGYRHKKGVFNCTYCNKEFDTKVKQKEHERAVHVYFNKRSKCGYCGEKFTDYTKKNEHEAKVHGSKVVVLKCQACNRSFDNQRALTVHTKSYHLLEGRGRK